MGQDRQVPSPPPLVTRLQGGLEADWESTLVRLHQRACALVLPPFDHRHRQIVQNPVADKHWNNGSLPKGAMQGSTEEAA